MVSGAAKRKKKAAAANTEAQKACEDVKSGTYRKIRGLSWLCQLLTLYMFSLRVYLCCSSLCLQVNLILVAWSLESNAA